MILEAIVTTLNPDNSVNIAPMGPVIEAATGSEEKCSFERFDLKPFETATTFANLVQRGQGVLHVTDDVELFASAAIGALDSSTVATEPSARVDGAILSRCCRYYEFEVEYADTSTPRAVFKCRAVASGRKRDFFGFNRARHAVIEAAILATRIAFIPADVILQQYADLRTIVEKTGGCKEHTAFEMLDSFVRNTEPAANPATSAEQ